MMGPFSDNQIERETTSAERSGRWQYVDIHCHCLAAVDDGPATMHEALALCRELAYDGVNVVIATPHQLGRFSDCNGASQIREAVSVLNEELRDNEIPLTVMPGGDVRVDERICQLLEADRILTLADGGRYILLELPHEILIDIRPLLVELASRGVQAIISHPERHRVLMKQPNLLLKWLGDGAYLQVTAASLLGEFGSTVQRAAWHFLSSGWVSFVATDAHDLYGRRPLMRAAFEQICAKLGVAVARQVCIENPTRVLEGQNIRMLGSTTGKRTDERVRDTS
ncbi:MAG: tyrosine-protein phosphatase [Planctomycetota bacterium]|jgi:protein-tyrosine phosphatase